MLLSSKLKPPIMSLSLPMYWNNFLVHRFKSIMQGSGLRQSGAGINPKERYVHDGESIQGAGVTLVYANIYFSKLVPGNLARKVLLQLAGTPVNYYYSYRRQASTT